MKSSHRLLEHLQPKLQLFEHIILKHSSSIFCFHNELIVSGSKLVVMYSGAQVSILLALSPDNKKHRRVAHYSATRLSAPYVPPEPSYGLPTILAKQNGLELQWSR